MSDPQRLAERVRDRRYRLRLTQAMLARRTGLSEKQIGIIERAQQDNYSPATLIALDEGLEWAPGSSADTLDGKEPVETEQPAPSGDRQPSLSELAAELRRVRAEQARERAEREERETELQRQIDELRAG